jgi:hypothetical protein
MIRFQLSLTYLLLTACGGTQSAPSVRVAATTHDTTALVVVDRPTIIGFFRPAMDAAEANEDYYVEGQAHVGFALQDAEACLGRDSSRVVLVVDTAVRFQHNSQSDTIRFSHIDSLSYGIYLIAPGGKPRLISAPEGPSQLIPKVGEEIPAYFRRPPCGAK